MPLTEITDKSRWEEFSALKEQGIFLQSHSQKLLYESLGQKTWLFELPGINPVRSLVTKIEARRGTFLYLPYGPISENLDEQTLREFFGRLTTLAKAEHASFIRISPYWHETPENKQLLKNLGFRQAPIHMLAETLWVLELAGKSEEDLLMSMDKKHRNLVRRAEKDGVQIRKSVQSDAVERFLDLHWQTVGRHGFTPYPKAYFRKQVELFAQDHQALVLEAYWADQLLASAIIMYYGKAGAYHHGASSSDPEHRKIPASYLLQWEAIREAKTKGCSLYNFWGIAPENAGSKHPFYGITHFKTGFGGHKIDLLPCHDLVVNSKYYLNWTVEKIRKWKRGF